MPITSDQIKAIVASYWRYIKQCPVIALEVNSNLSSYSGEETADVLAVDKNRYLIETEVKVSLADLRRDIEKEKHRSFSQGSCVARYFYFAVPQDLANVARLICDELYPYAGVLGVNGLDEYGVAIYRKPEPLTGKRLSFSQVFWLRLNDRVKL